MNTHKGFLKIIGDKTSGSPCLASGVVVHGGNRRTATADRSPEDMMKAGRRAGIAAIGVAGLLLAAACASEGSPGRNDSDRDRTGLQTAPPDPPPPGGPPGYSTAFPPAVF